MKTLPHPGDVCLAPHCRIVQGYAEDVYLALPRRIEQGSAKDRRKMETGPAYSVLTVDADDAVLAQLHGLLAPEYEILSARSVDEALTLFSDARPDLVLTDFDLIDGNFRDIQALLKDKAEGRAVPFIIMADPADENTVDRCLQLGAADYLGKPLRNAVVKARVRTQIQIVRQMRMIEKLGFIDALTDIPNRRSFDAHMNKEWRRAVREKKSISFLMIDLDNFKLYNDTYGHLQGDALLKSAAKIFVDAARRPGDLAARLGGEEFGIILPDTKLQGARRIAEGIRAAAEADRLPVPGAEPAEAVTVSIGVASRKPKECDVLREFIAEADALLYAAKRSGRNKVCSSVA